MALGFNHDNFIYISVPETQFRFSQDFKPDPSILIPVETSRSEIESTLRNLTWEMVTAAMLKHFAYLPNHKDLPYYKQFILALKPDLIKELTVGAYIKAEKGDFDIAEEILLSLANFDPENVFAKLNLALVQEERMTLYSKSGNSDLEEEYRSKIEKIYEELSSKLDESSPEVAYFSGLFYTRTGNYEKGISLLKLFLSRSEDSEKKQKAEKIISAIEKENKNTHLFQAAFNHIRNGEEDTAITEITDFLKSNPGVWNGWFLLGWAKRRQSRFKEAKAAFLKALDLEKNNADIYNELSICDMELNLLKESRKYLDKAVELEPFNIKIISNLGVLALKENKIEDAIGYFKRVLEIDEEDPMALEYLKILQE